MKKYTILLILFIVFNYSKAQTILVNGNVISVQEDVTFPLWLDSMSTIEIGTQVVSISALEFNIVPANYGNSLVFSQTKTITSQETVPNGMTWKITAVLLDSTAINNSPSSGGGQVIVSGGGGNMPVGLSEQSPNTMNFEDALSYCESLQENSYDNWVIPTWEEMMFLIGGGIDFTGVRNSNELWTSTFSTSATYHYKVASTEGYSWADGPTDLNHVRCVRHNSISVSSSGSSSSGSNSTSNGVMQAVALSEESPNEMYYGDAMLYCDSLNEGGYDNWVIPSIFELEFLSAGGASIPGNRTTNFLWTRSTQKYQSAMSSRLVFDLSLGQGTESDYLNQQHTRCTRYESVLVNNSGSSSGNSNATSTLGNSMPTMISNESTSVMIFGDCALYCENLTESGYSDWIMPSIEQLTYAATGGCVIPDARTTFFIWSRSISDYSNGYVHTFKFSPPNQDDGWDQYHMNRTHNSSSFGANDTDPKCRCVR